MPTAPRVQRVPDVTPPAQNEDSDDDDDTDREVEALRARCRELSEENARLHRLLDEVAEVINGRRDKVLHDVRNVMNELVLLRKLVDEDQ